MRLFTALEPDRSACDAELDGRAGPAAGAGHPGAGVLAVRHPVRPALLPPGRQRRDLPRPRGLAVAARHRRAARARPDRRRPGPSARGQPHVVGGQRRPDPAGQARRPRLRGRGQAAGRRARHEARPDPRQAGVLRRRRQQGRRLLERVAVPARADRRRRRQGRRPADPRAARGLPGRAGRAAERAQLPAAVRDQPGPRARLPEPDHLRRVRRGAGGRRRVGQRRLGRGPRGCRAGVRPVAARHARLPHRRRRLDGPGARRRRRGGRPARRHPGHLDRRQGAGHRRAPARRHDQDSPGRPTTT